MKRSLILLLAIAVPAGLVAADEAWKTKPYQQWEMKDVQKVLNESPWVRVVHVEAKWQAAGGKGVPVDKDATAPGNYGAQGGQGGANNGSVGGNSSYGMGAGAPASANSGSIAQNSSIMNSAKTPEATFMVRWFSALSVREALARAQVLSGRMTEADAGKALADQPDEYAITVVGPDMTPFLKAEEKDLAASAYLAAKKQNTKIPATHVVIQRNPTAKPDAPNSVAVLVFYFPKKTPAGEPVFANSEKSAEFACASAGATVKASFDLSKMATSSGPDW